MKEKTHVAIICQRVAAGPAPKANSESTVCVICAAPIWMATTSVCVALTGGIIAKPVCLECHMAKKVPDRWPEEARA